MDLKQQIEHSPMGAYQWFIIAIATLLNILDGYDAFAMAFAAKAIQSELGLSTIELGYLLSASLLGMAIGSIFLAPLADKIGRRPLLLIAISLSTIGMAGVVYTSAPMAIGLYRVLTGIGIGGVLVGTNVLSSEYSSLRWRNLAIGLCTAGFSVGAMLVGFFAVVLQDSYGWRSIFVAGAMVTFACLVISWLWLPESIDFLSSKRPRGAQLRLNRIASRLRLEGSYSLPPLQVGGESQKSTSSVSQLLSKTYLSTTLLIWLAYFSAMFCFYFVSSWTPALLQESGASTGMMLLFGGACGIMLYSLLSTRWEVRSILLAFTLLSTLSIVLFVSYSSVSWLAMILVVVMGMLTNGSIGGLYTLAPRSYGSEVRSTGVGWAIGIGRIGAILAPTVAGFLLERGWEREELYLGFSSLMLVASLAIFLLKRVR